MVKIEANEMMNNLKNLFCIQDFLVCAHVLCDIPFFFPCAAFLAKLEYSCKRKRVILLPSFHHKSLVNLSINC